ncbi:hypothetical protein V2J09_021483 [Rumex salicifolius]
MSTDSSSYESRIQTAKAVLSAAGSLAAAVVVARSITNDLLPDELRNNLSNATRSLFSWFSSELTLVIDEFDGIESNHIFDSATLYLGTKTKARATTTPRRLKISRSETDPAINVAVDNDEPISDYYDGIWYTWKLVCRRIESKYFYNPRDMNSTLKSEVKSLELSFHRKHKERALNRYIPYIIEEAKRMKEEQKSIKLFTVSEESVWSGLNLNHPATFEKIAMDPDEKKTIMEDLERFVSRKEYYYKVGKAWKRGYLLYGPPGTGKSSLIAAMANYLKFNVYDLELSALNSNSDLRTLLLATENRSILVVEDIDCTVQLKNRNDDQSLPNESENNRPEKKVTLSGFLNFIDGLWSSCGDERIIIFTTNYKDKLDPALLRPGRMDVHVHMSYCTPSAFKILASNYLGVDSHELFEEIVKRIEQVQVTPAEVAEQLLKEDEPEAALQGLIAFLDAKKVGNDDERKKEESDESLEFVRQEAEGN